MRGERRKALSPSPELPRRSMVEVNPPASSCDEFFRGTHQRARDLMAGTLHHGHKFRDQSASRRIEANFKDFMWLSSWPSLSPPFISLALAPSNYFRSLNAIFSSAARPFPFSFIPHCLTFSSSSRFSRASSCIDCTPSTASETHAAFSFPGPVGCNALDTSALSSYSTRGQIVQVLSIFKKSLSYENIPVARLR